MCPWLKAGAGAGIAFSMVGLAFVAVSLFTDITRASWETLNASKGLIGFGCCGFAGFLAARATRRPVLGAAAGALGGAIAGITVPVSMYVLAYGFLNSVRRYPFEYHDFLRSGAPTAKAFLLSAEGQATVLSTSVGLVPVVVVFAGLVGGVIGFLGGLFGMRSGGSPANVLSDTAAPDERGEPTPADPQIGDQRARVFFFRGTRYESRRIARTLERHVERRQLGSIVAG